MPKTDVTVSHHLGQLGKQGLFETCTNSVWFG